MYAIYGHIYQYTPFMLAYIPAPWILWVILRCASSQRILRPRRWSTNGDEVPVQWPPIPLGFKKRLLRGLSNQFFFLKGPLSLGYF